MPESEAEHLASWEEAGNALSYFLCQRGHEDLYYCGIKDAAEVRNFNRTHLNEYQHVVKTESLCFPQHCQNFLLAGERAHSECFSDDSWNIKRPHQWTHITG